MGSTKKFLDEDLWEDFSRGLHNVDLEGDECHLSLK